jgi:hypothetical protein
VAERMTAAATQGGAAAFLLLLARVSVLNPCFFLVLLSFLHFSLILFMAGHGLEAR